MGSPSLSRLAAGTGIAALAVLTPGASHALSTVQAQLFANPPNLSGTPANLQFNGFNATNFPTLPAGATLTKVQLTLKGVTSGNFVSGNITSNPSAVLGTGGTFDIISNAVSLSQGNNNASGPVPTGTQETPGTFTSAITATTQTYIFDIWRLNPFIPNTSPYITASQWTTPTVSLPTSCGFSPRYSPSFLGVGLLTNNCAFTIDTTLATNPSFLRDSFLTYTYEEVPSPLPILGAGAAFGWSRRLRKRIAQSC